MYSSSYQTTTGAAFYKMDIINHLRRAKAERQLSLLLPDVGHLYAIMQVNANTKTIPILEHPVRVTDAEEDYWVIDMRPYVSKIAANGGKIPEEGPARLLITRTLLEIFWVVGRPLSLQKAGDLAMVVYAKWLSGLLRIKLHTDPQATLQVQLIAALYHLQQYITDEMYTDQVAEAYAIKLGRVFNTPSKETLGLLGNIGYMANLNAFCETLRNLVTVGGMELVDPRLMFATVSTSWFGTADARMLINTALEFPPIFITLVMASTHERNYKKTLIAEITQKEAVRYKLDEYCVSIETLLRGLYTRD